MAGDGKKLPEPLLPPETAEEVNERVAGYVVGALTVHSMAIADHHGIFNQLDKAGPSSSEDVASALSLSERWVRELLYQLASGRVISTNGDATLFWLNEGQTLNLAQESSVETSPYFSAPLAVCAMECLQNRLRTQDSFRTGLGLSYDQLGSGVACGICRELGVWTKNFLIARLKETGDIGSRLEQGIRVADIGCGEGEAVRVLAEAFPNSTFHGFDTSAIALQAARNRMDGVPNVAFKNPLVPGEELPEAAFDLIITLDAVHDMARPDLVLPQVRSALADGSIGYIIADIKSTGQAAKNMTEMGPQAQMFYGFSLGVCMSAALSEKGGLGLGALGWHERLAHTMLHQAGFSDVQNLDWESKINQFYWAKA